MKTNHSFYNDDRVRILSDRIVHDSAHYLLKWLVRYDTEQMTLVKRWRFLPYLLAVLALLLLLAAVQAQEWGGRIILLLLAAGAGYLAWRLFQPRKTHLYYLNLYFRDGHRLTIESRDAAYIQQLHSALTEATLANE